MEAQRGDQGSSSTSTTFLRKGKSDSLIARWTSFERKLQATNSMKGIVNRKDNAFHLPPTSYPLFDMECEGGHSSTSSPYKNMISRTSSATASLSLGIAGPLIFPSEHALTSIIDGSCNSKGEDDDDVSDESKGNSTMTYQLHEKHIPPTAQAYSIPIDVGNDDHNVLSPPPISLKFVNVTYKVAIVDEHSRCVSNMMKRAGGRSSTGAGGEEMRRKRKTKKILKGITGYVLPGEVLALMGPSGSGKTTLLNLLSGRLNIASSSSHQYHHGTITYNDLPYSKALKRRMGFVMQDDVLYPHLTVKETLTYAAILRLPKKLSKKQRMERAMQVIYELGLERCQDTMIGGPFFRGVSGGERKRVCMGQEILIDPSLLFLDEPTSGLDSTTALRIIHMLRRISQVGRTVVTTIHQPSSRLFHMFHKLILISEGHLIYFGEARAAMDYFSSIGFSPQLAMNPADFLLDLASGNVIDMSLPTHLQHIETSPTTQFQAPLAPQTLTRLSAKNVRQYLSKAYEASWELEERSKLVEDQLSSMKEKSGGAMLLMKEREWSSTWWLQFWVLYVRGMRERRHEYLSLLRVFQVVVSALIIGCLWWHSDVLTERHLADQVGLLFFIATYWGFFPLFTALFTFPQERAILAKERACDMYRLSAYFMARTLGDIPLDFCLPLIFHIIVYFMASLRLTASAFFFTLLTILLSTIAAQGLGIAIGAIMMDLKKATTLASVALLTFMLSGGFFVQRIPTFISWIRYISYNYHTFKLLVKVQYDGGQHIDCDTPIGCRKVVNSTIFHELSLDGGVQEVVVLLSMIVGYRLIAYVALRHMRLV